MLSPAPSISAKVAFCSSGALSSSSFAFPSSSPRNTAHHGREVFASVCLPLSRERKAAYHGVLLVLVALAGAADASACVALPRRTTSCATPTSQPNTPGPLAFAAAPSSTPLASRVRLPPPKRPSTPRHHPPVASSSLKSRSNRSRPACSFAPSSAKSTRSAKSTAVRFTISAMSRLPISPCSSRLVKLPHAPLPKALNSPARDCSCSKSSERVTLCSCSITTSGAGMVPMLMLNSGGCGVPAIRSS
mmetsp:Transcript_28550/g.50005  ORF Transcript_28550/g.50005 Transcript_28550/m.50005 type:complete len:247 (-) Transcript_28550:160-900(-)